MQLTDLYQSIDFRRTFKIVEWHILIIKKAKTVALLSITYYVDYLSFLMLLRLFFAKCLRSIINIFDEEFQP